MAQWTIDQAIKVCHALISSLFSLLLHGSDTLLPTESRIASEDYAGNLCLYVHFDSTTALKEVAISVAVVVSFVFV